jgi:hypothetical protein
MKKGRTSATECCAFLDVSQTTFGKLIADGVFERQRHQDGYDLRLVVSSCCRHWR